MFEEITKRNEPIKQKVLVKIKFAVSKTDAAPRLVLSLTKEVLGNWNAGTPCGLQIGRDADAGKIKVVFNSPIEIGVVRRMRLGGAVIDFGVVDALNAEGGVKRALPLKEATVLSKTANEIVLAMPVWRDDEVVPPRKPYKKASKEMAAPAPAQKDVSKPPERYPLPLCTINPPAVIFNGKRVALTTYQAVVMAELIKRYKKFTPTSTLTHAAFIAASIKMPAGFDATLPVTIAQIEDKLADIGLGVVYSKGEGWGLGPVR